MIKTEFGYRQSLEILNQLEMVLQDEKNRYLPHSPKKYKVVSGGTLRDIKKIKAEISEYEKSHQKIAA